MYTQIIAVNYCSKNVNQFKNSIENYVSLNTNMWGKFYARKLNERLVF